MNYASRNKWAAWIPILVCVPSLLHAQNIPAVHWINDAGSSADAVLNTNGVFVTDFKGDNDLKVTRIGSDPVALSTDVFGGSTPGNNPWYGTEFVGVAGNGTGDGSLGDIMDLNMTTDATGTLQFDFLRPLSPQDRILLIDTDGAEEYQFQAYVLEAGNYVQVSVAGWNTQDFTGTTGELPTSQWPVWNGTNGTAYSGAMPNTDLDQELFVLSPDQNIDRLQIYKLTGMIWSTDITFETPTTAATTPTVFSLQTSTSAMGPYTNIFGAVSPYTNAIASSSEFFRLISN